MRTAEEMDRLAKSPNSNWLMRMAVNMTLGQISQSAGAVDAYVPDTPLGIGFTAAGAPGALRYTNGVVSELRAVSKPYNAREIGRALDEAYPGQVKSSTLPNATDKNVGLAGKRHPASGIVFDSRGFPIFDDVAVFDTRIGSQYSAVENSAAHMRAATRDLRGAIERGEVSAAQFTPEQLRAIQAGEAKIPDLTWHHHQDVGRMQLIPTTIHNQTGHIGGCEMWFRGLW
jgi:hypothetical protein